MPGSQFDRLDFHGTVPQVAPEAGPIILLIALVLSLAQHGLEVKGEFYLGGVEFDGFFPMIDDDRGGQIAVGEENEA